MGPERRLDTMGGQQPPDGAYDVLVLCTGNICRSPMGEAFLAQHLRDRGIDAHVHSAGLVLDGRPASRHGVTALEALGFDLRGHRSRIVDGQLLAEADLIVTMAREHLREAVVTRPDVWSRAFTLKELVRRGGQIGPRRPDESLSDWLARCHEGRSHNDLLGEDPTDDVADPYGSSLSDYERTAREIRDLIDRLVVLAFPTRRNHLEHA